MLKLAMLLMLFCDFCFAEALVAEVEYQNNPIYFQALKSKSKFTFSDRLGSRSLAIKPCNEKLIGKFWQDLTKNIISIQRYNAPRGQSQHSSAWLKYEGIQYPILDFDPTIRYFNKVPNNTHVLFSESKTLCK